MTRMALSSIQLEAFLAVAQNRSFTKAASQLNITQSALSQRVMNLEEELETALFIRDKAGIRLTQKAEELVRLCICKNSLEDEFLFDLKEKNLAGVVRIGGFSSVMHSVVLQSLARLFAKNGNLKLQLVVDELYNLSDRLRRGEIEYLISTKDEKREDIEKIELGREKNVLAQKRGYDGNEIYLDHDEYDHVTNDYLKLARKRPKVMVRRYLGNVNGLLEGVRLGFGRAVLPLHLIKDHREFEILNPGTVYEIPVYLYFYAQPYYTKLHSAVVAELEKNVAPLLG
jgi:DNA-binding transcriptional LysR family regulator